MATYKPPSRPSHHDIIVIGTSAGGVKALKVLASGLPADLQAAIFIARHIPSEAHSQLPWLLMRVGSLPAAHAQHGKAIRNGHIYVAPPGHHLTLAHGVVRVRQGPREHGSRSAIDALFQSAAQAYGRRVVGVILTGTLHDGTAGLMAVKAQGGMAVVQDPEEALYAAMPRHAMNAVAVDYCLPVTAIAPLLVRLTHALAAENGGEAVAADTAREAAAVQST